MYNYPTPEITAEDWEFVHLMQIPNTGFHPDYTRKRMGLIGLGLSEEEAEELCRPKKVDMEAVMEQIKAFQEKELKRLAKLNPKPKKQGKLELEEVDGLPVISPVDLPVDKKWMATGADLSKS
jgi:hypothetical protein